MQANMKRNARLAHLLLPHSTRGYLVVVVAAVAEVLAARRQQALHLHFKVYKSTEKRQPYMPLDNYKHASRKKKR